MTTNEFKEFGYKVKWFGSIHSDLVTTDGVLMARMYKCKSTYGYLYAVFIYFDDIPEKLVHLTSTELIAVERMKEIRLQLAA